MRVRRRFIQLKLIITLAVSMGLALASENDQNNLHRPALNIKVYKGLCTIHAESTSLQHILLAIGKQAGIDIHIDGDLSEIVLPLHYQETKLATVLSDLLRSYSTVMLYNTPEATEEENEQPPSKIWVYIESNTSAKISILATKIASPTTLDIKTQQIDRLEGLPKDTIIDALSSTFNSASDPLVRQHAITKIAQTYDTSALALLEQGMSDDSAQVRRETAKVFAGIKEQRALLWLGQLIMSDTDNKVREEAVHSLVQHGSPAARAFVEAATKDKTESVRKTAASALLQWIDNK